VFSGFKIENNAGVYLNSCEVIDLNNTNTGWTLVNFERIGCNMKLSAMGVINIGSNGILLCGGYDGTQYLNKVSSFEAADKEILSLETLKTIMPGNYIFMHSNFIPIDNIAYNFDLQMNAISYNTAKGTFNVKF
jgi:hypothetical protein